MPPDALARSSRLVRPGRLRSRGARRDWRSLETRKALPKTFSVLKPGCLRDDVLDRHRADADTLNSEQSRRRVEAHICPLQFDIVDRAIRLYSNPGDLVFDPFAGLGTVPMRAVKLGRRGYGVELNEPVEPIAQRLTSGELIRFRCDGDGRGGRTAGRSSISTSVRPAHSATTGSASSRKWKSGDDFAPLSPEERVALQREWAEAKQAPGRARAVRDRGAVEALEMWTARAQRAPTTPMSRRSGWILAAARARRQAAGPDGRRAGKLWNLQRIAGDGTKRFLRGGRTDGLFCLIGYDTAATRETFCIGEGYATMAAVHRASGTPASSPSRRRTWRRSRGCGTRPGRTSTSSSAPTTTATSNERRPQGRRSRRRRDRGEDRRACREGGLSVARDFEDIERDFGGEAVREALARARSRPRLRAVWTSRRPESAQLHGHAVRLARSGDHPAAPVPLRLRARGVRSARSSRQARPARRRSRSAARSAWRRAGPARPSRLERPASRLAVEPRGRSRGGREDRPRLPQAVGPRPDELGDRLFINGADSIGANGLKLAVEDNFGGFKLQRPVSEALIEELKRQADRLSRHRPVRQSATRSTRTATRRSTRWPRNGCASPTRRTARSGWRITCARRRRRVHRSGRPRRRRDDQRRPLVPGAAAHEPERRRKLQIEECDRKRYFRSTTTRTTRPRPRSRPEWYEFVSVGLGNGDVTGRRTASARSSAGAARRVRRRHGAPALQHPEDDRENPMKARKHSKSKWIGSARSSPIVLDLNLDTNMS
jgi:hypothetical protein